VSVRERLQEFLYLMMRDEVPTGVVCKKIMEVDECDSKRPVFSNPHLAALADDYAGRLLESSSASEPAESG